MSGSNVNPRAIIDRIATSALVRQVNRHSHVGERHKRRRHNWARHRSQAQGRHDYDPWCTLPAALSTLEYVARVVARQHSTDRLRAHRAELARRSPDELPWCVNMLTIDEFMKAARGGQPPVSAISGRSFLVVKGPLPYVT